jgi:hypothetical protein
MIAQIKAIGYNKLGGTYENYRNGRSSSSNSGKSYC